MSPRASPGSSERRLSAPLDDRDLGVALVSFGLGVRGRRGRDFSGLPTMRILARDGNPGAWSWWAIRLGPRGRSHFLSGRLSRTHPLNPISCDQVDDDTHRDFGIVFGMVGLNSSSTIPKSGVVEQRTWSQPPPPARRRVALAHPTFPMVPLGMSTAHGCYHSQKIAGEDEVDPAAPAPLALAVDEPRDQADQVGCAPARLSPVRRRVAPLVIHLKNGELRRSLN